MNSKNYDSQKSFQVTKEEKEMLLKPLETENKHNKTKWTMMTITTTIVVLFIVNLI